MTAIATYTNTRFDKITISDGSIEAIKWLAILLMTVDHVNKYLFSASSTFAFSVGRIAMPLFVLVLAYNLARTGVLSRGTYIRSYKRLGFFAAISTIPFIALAKGAWWPLNILYLLLLGVSIIALSESGKKSHSWLAFLLFMVGGAFVEYWWPGLALMLVAWKHFKSPNIYTLLGTVALTASLWVINQNHWALLALPIFFASAKIDIPLPRTEWYVFYLYYPLHLSIILATTVFLAD